MKKIIIFLKLLLFSSVFGQVDTLYENGNIVKDTINVNEIIVTTFYKATKNTPVSFKNIDTATINLYGRELEPTKLLQHTPSVSFYTENGSFTGYTYYRLRGIDQTRINVTLNGVPMNEPEDQGIYFNNYTNFLQTISNVQIIRGVGVSKSGVSSYGGSINFESYDYNEENPFVSIGYGSFRTLNMSCMVPIEKGWISVSYLGSDGFKEHSTHESASIFYNKKLFKHAYIYGFVTQQFNQLAWVGSPLDSIKQNHKYNSNKDYEKDDFLYLHNQFHYDKNKLSLTLYHTYLKGNYNWDDGHWIGIFNSSFGKLELNSHWFGENLNYKLNIWKFKNNVGLSSYVYHRNHDNLWGEKLNKLSSYNKNTGFKNEITSYFKTNLKIFALNVYGDIQYRKIDFTYSSDTMIKQQYKFLNWSYGFTTNLSKKLHLYAGLGNNYREPTRTDLFSGFDYYDPDFYNNVIPESVMDYEFGLKYYGDNLKYTINYYYMNFDNEIVLNGQIGPNSIVLHSNVAESFRKGLELDLKYNLGNFEFLNNYSFSKNEINQHDTILTQILSPSVISTSDIIYNFGNNKVGLTFRYNSESFINFENTEKLPPYNIINLYSIFNFSNGIELSVRLNNLLNRLYFTSGNMDFINGTEPRYFQQAGFNVFVNMKFRLMTKK